MDLRDLRLPCDPGDPEMVLELATGNVIPLSDSKTASQIPWNEFTGSGSINSFSGTRQPFENCPTGAAAVGNRLLGFMVDERMRRMQLALVNGDGIAIDEIWQDANGRPVNKYDPGKVSVLYTNGDLVPPEAIEYLMYHYRSPNL